MPFFDWDATVAIPDPRRYPPIDRLPTNRFPEGLAEKREEQRQEGLYDE